MKLYQKGYEAYMKQVTDGFIGMQKETTTQEDSNEVMSQMWIVKWNGGLKWHFIIQEGSMFRDGNLMEETRKYNAEIANKYLKANTLTYNQWVKMNIDNIFKQMEL